MVAVLVWAWEAERALSETFPFRALSDYETMTRDLLRTPTVSGALTPEVMASHTRGPRLPSRTRDPQLVDPRIQDVEALARWLDYAFELPGGFRFGVAGIVGLIPGIGDLFDALVSLYIVLRAVQLRLPRVALTRMLMNVGIEAVAGTVPVIGDLFDVAFKANRRNYHLLRQHLLEPERQKTLDTRFVAIALLVALLAVALPVFALIEIVRAF